eukprot:364001-Chlamydomonas_euryale.AAC.15
MGVFKTPCAAFHHRRARMHATPLLPFARHRQVNAGTAPRHSDYLKLDAASRRQPHTDKQPPSKQQPSSPPPSSRARPRIARWEPLCNGASGRTNTSQSRHTAPAPAGADGIARAAPTRVSEWSPIGPSLYGRFVFDGIEMKGAAAPPRSEIRRCACPHATPRGPDRDSRQARSTTRTCTGSEADARLGCGSAPGTTAAACAARQARSDSGVAAAVWAAEDPHLPSDV